jgi:cytochrome c5
MKRPEDYAGVQELKEILQRQIALLMRVPGALLRNLRSLPQRVVRTVFKVERWTIGAVFKALLVIAGTALGLTIAVFSAVLWYIESQIPVHEEVNTIHYLDQGWGPAASSPDRQLYYYTPQGTSIYELRYSWFVHLERAWSNKKFREPKYMRGLGFVVDNTRTDANPDQLPVGFAKHFEEKLQEDVLDITCAACHTGELHVVQGNERTAIRIDGGQAMHAFTSLKPGQFGIALLASMVSTYANPVRFHRFARNVLGNDHYTLKGILALRHEFTKVLWALASQGFHDKIHKLYPVEEGFGRTDAIGRISNRVFSDYLTYENDRLGNAPVSFPTIWDAWKYNWVQFTASVSQPLARNMGESLGVGAALEYLDPYGRPVPKERRFYTTSLVDQLDVIEKTLWRLEPPAWPEKFLGKIDQEKAARGKTLFGTHCAGCHAPCLLSDETRAVWAPGKKADDMWRVNPIDLQDVGTDPMTALNFVNVRVDISKTGLTDDEARDLLRDVYKIKMDRLRAFRKKQDKQYDKEFESCRGDIEKGLDGINVKSISIGGGLNIVGLILKNRFFRMSRMTPAQQADYEGFGALDLPQVVLKYRAKPLEGIWSSAPYLHNGSVPNLYEVLLPANQRSKKFFVTWSTFDSTLVGLSPEQQSARGFWFDTTIKGNWNIGHEFRAGYRDNKGAYPPNAPYAYGVIGPELKDSERWDLVEYLKIHKDQPGPCPPYKPAPCGEY